LINKNTNDTNKCLTCENFNNECITCTPTKYFYLKNCYLDCNTLGDGFFHVEFAPK